jgi:hypothetical protein
MPLKVRVWKKSLGFSGIQINGLNPTGNVCARQAPSFQRFGELDKLT